MNYSTFMKTQQEIYNEIKSSDNKQLWSLANTYANIHKRLQTYIEKEKDKTKKSGGVDLSQILEDKSLLRTRVLEHLFEESSKGNAQASAKLGQLANLGEESQDITIIRKSYCGECGGCLQK
tara:strand:- start:5533 stop:5898 length:366 start_codon:yes stop_codon:yes gene_type:complete